MTRCQASWNNAYEIHREACFALVGISIGPFIGSIEAIRYLRELDDNLEANSGSIMCAIAGASATIITLPWLLVTFPVALVGSGVLIVTTPLTFCFKLTTSRCR